MKWDLLFFFNSVLLGVGLAMDAFSGVRSYHSAVFPGV